MAQTKDKDYVMDFFAKLFEDNCKKGETFSKEIGEQIQEELKKMQRQKEEWLRNKENLK